MHGGCKQNHSHNFVQLSTISSKLRQFVSTAATLFCFDISNRGRQLLERIPPVQQRGYLIIHPVSCLLRSAWHLRDQRIQRCCTGAQQFENTAQLLGVVSGLQIVGLLHLLHEVERSSLQRVFLHTISHQTWARATLEDLPDTIETHCSAQGKEVCS